MRKRTRDVVHVGERRVCGVAVRFSPDGTQFAANYDVAPDGKFLMLRVEEDLDAPTQINVALGWFEGLKLLRNPLRSPG